MHRMLAMLLMAGWCAAAWAGQPPEPSEAPGGASSFEDEIAKALGEEQPPPSHEPLWPSLSITHVLQQQAGAIFDFTSDYTRHRGGHSTHNLRLREVELSYWTRLGPFARFDVFVGVHKHAHEHLHLHHDEEEEEEDHHEHEEAYGALGRSYDITRGYSAEIEEAYFTFVGLPAGLTARAGKFKAAFGWANTVHPHAWPWIDAPLAISNALGHHGLAGVGVELNWLAPWQQPYTELAFECLRTSGETFFTGESWHDRVHLVHLANVFDLTPTSTFEVGLSAATGPQTGGQEGRRATVEGLDLTYKWRPVQEGLYRSFAWRTELLATQKRDEEGSRQNACGFYTGPEYQFARCWSAGARADYSQLPDADSFWEKGGSLYVTCQPSEYCFWRAGVMRTKRNFERAGSKDDTMLFLQLNFGFGAHRAHQY